MDQRRLERVLASLHRADRSGSVLQRICVVAAEEGDARAGVSRLTDGSHQVLAASDTTAEGIEELQVATGEGPCKEAVRTFQPCLEPDLRSARAFDRWPTFAPLAVQRGVEAVFAFPLMAGGVAVGALDVYAHRQGELEAGAVTDVLLLADLAALAVEHGRGLASIEEVDLATDPAEEWAHTAVVHNASGMVSEQLDIDVRDALLRLRAYAFSTERPLGDVAGDVVARKLRLESWFDA